MTFFVLIRLVTCEGLDKHMQSVLPGFFVTSKLTNIKYEKYSKTCVNSPSQKDQKKRFSRLIIV